MDHTDVQHHDRFEQMKSEVNHRQVDWWYCRPKDMVFDETLEAILDIMQKQTTVGPFGSRFIAEGNGHYKPSFYDIPLQYSMVEEKPAKFTGLAYVATNDSSSVLLSTVFDYLRTEEGYSNFLNINLAAICVQTAQNNHGRKMVVQMTCISRITPLTFYEHPSNGRLLMAMGGNLQPEHTALAFGGDVVQPKMHVQETMSQATELYNSYDLGNTEKAELLSSLLSFYF